MPQTGYSLAQAAFMAGEHSVLTVADSEFMESLTKVSATVLTWPKWKRELLGKYTKLQ